MAKFELAEMLKGVSELNTQQEQIVYLPLEKLLPDPDNFYSLEGLEDLAANIELVGLQQPLRVRPNADGNYPIISGHRRRAAIQLIVDGGSKQFDSGVPCIIEHQANGSKAMQELRLIFANSATRVMSPADLSKQAERVTELLYQLKQEGVEFPGRMRAHVAQACQVSESKLARLHAIRSTLNSGLLKYFDSGEMVEDVAYQLSRLPANVQRAISARVASGEGQLPNGPVLRQLLPCLPSFLKKRECKADACDCSHQIEVLLESAFKQYFGDICTGDRCCSDCYKRGFCDMACDIAKMQAERELERSEKQKNKEYDKRLKATQQKAKLLLPLIERAGLSDADCLDGRFNSPLVCDVKTWAAGGNPPRGLGREDALLPYQTMYLIDMAKRLKCTLDQIVNPPCPVGDCSDVGMDITEPDPEDVDYVRHEWDLWGDPPINVPGWYAVKVQIADTDVIVRKVLWWDECWFLNDRPDASLLDETNKVVGWFPLPDDSEEG